MKNLLHIIGNNKLYGLADSNEIEIVECVYDNIKHLKSGKYIVIKDKMAGVLDERGKTFCTFNQTDYILFSKWTYFTIMLMGKKFILDS